MRVEAAQKTRCGYANTPTPRNDPFIYPKEPEAVLLGSAILGAVAAGAYASIQEAMGAMCHAGEVIEPNRDTADYHAWKYEQQLAMYDQHVNRRSM